MAAINNVLEISRKLEKLNNRLAELDAERRSIQSEIALCMSELGSATSAHIFPDENASSRQRVLWVMHKFPERPISPKDICIESGLDGSTVRSLLPRMALSGLIRQVSHGRYQLIRR